MAGAMQAVLMSVSTGGAAGISFKGAGTSTTSGNDVIITVPTHVEGDLLLVRVSTRDNGGQTWATPAGWTMLADGSSPVANTNTDPGVFYKIAGASEPATVTFTVTTSKTPMGGIMLSYSGATSAALDTITSYGSNPVSAINTTTAISAGKVLVCMAALYTSADELVFTITDGATAGNERIETVYSDGSNNITLMATEFADPAVTTTSVTTIDYGPVSQYAVTNVILREPEPITNIAAWESYSSARQTNESLATPTANDNMTTYTGYNLNWVQVINPVLGGTMWGSPYNNPAYVTNDSPLGRVVQHGVLSTAAANGNVTNNLTALVQMTYAGSQVTTGITRNGYTSSSFASFASMRIDAIEYFDTDLGKAVRTTFPGQTTEDILV
jgi:hypothetical protein